MSMPSRIKTIPAQIFQNNRFSHRDEALAAEEPLEIRIGHGAGERRRRLSVAVTMRTPGEDEDLAVGFLFTEGVLQRADSIVAVQWLEEDVVSVELQPNLPVDTERLTRHLFTTSSCGVCGKASLDAVHTAVCYYPEAGRPVVSPETLCALPAALRRAQATFEATGGLHAAGLFDATGKLLLLREDIGRHNAVDKVIGAALRGGMHFPLKDHILLVSGRAGFEIVQKAAMAGLPILAAVGAPSSIAVELAEASGMTLVGFLREGRFNVYSAPERIDPSRLP